MTGMAGSPFVSGESALAAAKDRVTRTWATAHTRRIECRAQAVAPETERPLRDWQLRLPPSPAAGHSDSNCEWIESTALSLDDPADGLLLTLISSGGRSFRW